MFTYGNPIFPRKRYVRVQNGRSRSHLVYLHEDIYAALMQKEFGEMRSTEAKYLQNKHHTHASSIQELSIYLYALEKILEIIEVKKERSIL